MAVRLGVSWLEEALCRSTKDPDLWFPTNRRAGDGRKAKAYCRVCPAQDKCLTEALANPDTRGIWGGTDEDDRSAIRKRQRSTARA